eukprot:4852364-Pleurochrysis_carterae.AAC.2
MAITTATLQNRQSPRAMHWFCHFDRACTTWMTQMPIPNDQRPPGWPLCKPGDHPRRMQH